MTTKRNNETFTKEVALAPDGSGKLAYTSSVIGEVTLEVPAGSGKRPIVLKQARGVCQWVFSPI